MERWKELQKQLEKYNDQLQDGDVSDKQKHRLKIAAVEKELKELEQQLIKMGHKEIPIIKAKSKKLSKK